MNANTASAPHWIRGRFASWVFATDHKRIGVLWLAIGGVGVTLGGILALVNALQTWRADAAVVGANAFASSKTMQDTLLTYGGLLPLALGLAVALVPLQIGARGLERPNLAAGAFWLGLAGLVAIVLSAFAPGDAARSAWTTAPPLAIGAEPPGETTRIAGLLLLSLAVLLTAWALLATLKNRRAPGLTDARLPLFSASVRVFAVALVLLGAVAVLGNLLLLLARENPGSFDWYITEDGGLLRGYGWIFSQGIVVSCLVPALGAAAEIIATFSRRPLAARGLILMLFAGGAAALAIVPSLDLAQERRWAAVLVLLAAAALAAIAVLLVPAAVRAATGGHTNTPALFAAGSLLLTVLGAAALLIYVLDHSGLRGTSFAAAPQTLLWTGGLTALVGGVVYWWPKLFGRALNARLAALVACGLSFGGLAVGVGQAVAGWQDQPFRAAGTVESAEGGALLSTLGLLALAGAVLAFGLMKLQALNGRRVGNDPWLADTLEWYTTSPPPLQNFTSLPPIESERPLADRRRSLESTGAL